jgi:15-cis-phytoene synthase
MLRDPSPLPQDAREQLQSFLPDHYLACGFIPILHREAVTTLYAFASELQAVTWRAREPMMGEIRLQWWREALLGERPRSEVEAHPLASHLLEQLTRFQLPVKGLVDLVDGLMDDLYDDPPDDLTALEFYCGQTSSVLMRYASLMLADGGEAGKPETAGPAGVAFGLTEIILHMTNHVRNGRVKIPQTLLQKAGLKPHAIQSLQDRETLCALTMPLLDLAQKRLDDFKCFKSSLPTHVRPAFALMGLVKPRIMLLRKALMSPSYQPFEPVADINPLSKIMRLWMAAVWGRV